MDAATGLKELVDALFSFEIRYSSEALCLQAATWSPVPVLLLHNLSVLLVRVFIVPTFPQLLSILKGAVLICFCQGVFTVICSTPGLTVLLQDLPSRTGQKVDFLSQEKMSRFKCYYCKGSQKSNFITYYLNGVPGEICPALILSLYSLFSFLSFLFFIFPYKVNITFSNTVKFSVRNKFDFGYRKYTGLFDILLVVKKNASGKEHILMLMKSCPPEK